MTNSSSLSLPLRRLRTTYLSKLLRFPPVQTLLPLQTTANSYIRVFRSAALSDIRKTLCIRRGLRPPLLLRSLSSILSFSILLRGVRFSLLPYFSTVITQSGHIIAHDAHPIHAFISVISTTKYPFLLLVPEICNNFFGQDKTHRPQPLQLSFFIVIFAILLTPRLFLLYLIVFYYTNYISFCKAISLHTLLPYPLQLLFYTCFNSYSTVFTLA